MMVEWNDLKKNSRTVIQRLDYYYWILLSMVVMIISTWLTSNVTDDQDPRYLDDDTKVCVARATIEKDKYVGKRDLNNDGDTDDEGEGAEDYLLHVSDAEDAPSDISADTSSASDSDTSDDYDGWNVNTGVLTLIHDDKPADWIQIPIILQMLLFGIIIEFGKMNLVLKLLEVQV